MATASDTRFGIEMETFIPETYRRMFMPGAYHHGNQIENSPDGWNSQRDGSLHTTRRSYFPAEVVSPILAGENGLAETFYMCEYLGEVNATVNGSTGLHIHVDASGLTARQITRIKNAFRRYEMAFYGLNGSKAPSRIQSHYCNPSDRWDGGRYQSLNLTNVGSAHKDTIEIRCFSGTIDPEIIVTAAYMAVGLVNMAKSASLFDEYQSRIEDPTAAATEFCRRVFSNPDNLIVPDESPADVTRTLKSQCRKAKRAFERRASGNRVTNRYATAASW